MRESEDVVYYSYDDADRLTGETWKDSGGGTVYAFEWDYDAVGNRTCEDRNGVKTYYTYDQGNELLRYHELPADTWTYFAYDSRGNTTRIQEPDGTTYFAYTDADLIDTIRHKTGVMNYFYYDAMLRRYAMQDSGGLAYFAWDRNGLNLLCERDTAGNVTAEYAHGHTPIGGIGTMVAARKVAGGATYYQYPVYDHRGTVLRLTDEAGAVTAYYEYDPWGVLLRNDDTPVGNRFKYQSNWLDLKDGGGLALSKNRLVHTKTGRFLQRETPGRLFPPYVYCMEDPVGRVDPDGAEFKAPYGPRTPLQMARDAAKKLKERLVSLESEMFDHPERMSNITNYYETAVQLLRRYEYLVENETDWYLRDRYEAEKTILTETVMVVGWHTRTLEIQRHLITRKTLLGDEEEKDDLLFVEELACSTTEGFHSIQELLASSIGKAVIPSGGAAHDLLEMFKKLGLTTGYVKNHNGTDYLILKGYAGLRKFLQGTRYLESNPVVHEFVAVRHIGGSLTKKAVRFGVVSTIALNIIQGFVDQKTLGEIGVSVGVDLAVTAISLAAGSAFTAICTGAGTAICPVIGTAAGFVFGVAVAYLCDWAAGQVDLKQKIYDAIQEAINFQVFHPILSIGGV